MKTNKEQIYDLMQLHFKHGQSEGASTQGLSEILNIQRTNVSSLLNALVEEGVVVKTNGRPVRYFAKKDDRIGANCFNNLVGHDGSLKRAVQLAQAAVLYPRGSLNALIVGPCGMGKKFHAMMMYHYAVENNVILPDAPYYVIDCANFTRGTDDVIVKIFGEDNAGGYYEAACRGVLVIDNLHLISTNICNQLFDLIDSKEEEDSYSKIAPHIVAICDDGNTAVIEETKRWLPVLIEIPPLEERPLEERKSLIQNFFTVEAVRASRVIIANAELMRCLLLCDFNPMNIVRLKYDIKMGCANAYVRERINTNGVMNLYIGDFENYVRKGFLKYKLHRDTIEQIIPLDYNYRFSESTFEMTAIDKDKLKDHTMYSIIDRRAKELVDRGVSENDIGLFLVAELETQFKSYQKELSQKVLNVDQLSKLVNPRIISIVQNFLEEISSFQAEPYPESVFYGLCLHLDASLKTGSRQTGLEPKQIKEILENYRKEYASCLNLASVIEKEFNVVLTVDEVVLLTMFICFKTPIININDKPVVLYAFHGAGLAKSLVSAVNSAVKLNNVFYYEIPFEDDLSILYERLCIYVRQIDKGQGVVVVYDMEYLVSIFTTISAETQVELRLVPLPIINIGFEISRKAASEKNIDTLYQNISEMMSSYTAHKKPVIVTLCDTGVGGAQELKKYIQRHANLQGTAVVELASAGKEKLREDLQTLMGSATIKCIVGAQNPNLFGLPFIPVSEVFGVATTEIEELFQGGYHKKKMIKTSEDFDAVCDYLGEHLEHISVQKLKKLLPIVMKDINTHIAHISSDTEVGLFLHIPCCIERMLAKESLPVSINKAQIIDKYLEEYKKLVRILKPLEKAFDVIFNDDELAILLTIINKL